MKSVKNIPVLHGGSSSIKFAIYGIEEQFTLVLSGSIENTGSKYVSHSFTDGGSTQHQHVRGYKGEGTTTTPFGMGSKAAYTKKWLQNKLLDRKAYIEVHGEDMPEILDWKWNILKDLKQLQ